MISSPLAAQKTICSVDSVEILMVYLDVIFHPFFSGKKVINTASPELVSFPTTGSSFMPTKFLDESFDQNACHRAQVDTPAEAVLKLAHRLAN